MLVAAFPFLFFQPDLLEAQGKRKWEDEFSFPLPLDPFNRIYTTGSQFIGCSISSGVLSCTMYVFPASVPRLYMPPPE